MNEPQRQVSSERQFAYYLGAGVIVLGGLMFLSTFALFIANFGEFNNFEGKAKTSMALAFGGMVLMIIGGIIRSLGATGLAGSGAVLDPEQARKDLEPYSRMTGGMISDALSEINPNPTNEPPPRPTIKVRCRACGILNEEDARFCKQCGKPL
jgi:hypothetical protein